jgi:hypothetical protein
VVRKGESIRGGMGKGSFRRGGGKGGDGEGYAKGGPQGEGGICKVGSAMGASAKEASARGEGGVTGEGSASVWFLESIKQLIISVSLSLYILYIYSSIHRGVIDHVRGEGLPPPYPPPSALEPPQPCAKGWLKRPYRHSILRLAARRFCTPSKTGARGVSGPRSKPIFMKSTACPVWLKVFGAHFWQPSTLEP